MLIAARALEVLLESPSVTGVILADGVTGLTYTSAGSSDVVGDGAQLADLANLITDTLNAAGVGARLESVTITAADRYEIVRTLAGPRDEDELLLGLVMDRAGTNLALAMRQAEELAASLLA